MHINLNILRECGLEMPEPEWTVDEYLEYAKKKTFTREDGTQVWGTILPNGILSWVFL